ncbi:condensation domain-containing protein [Colwellia sp. MSW7]|uniref:Condensation domain-containing protein n=1 Tax=Colwellia maritima TaxID=2912588 RepID=A0ABS9X7D9_9GAMM|nr:condensation domain-containing protein [Colwellia maritima]MCI2286150.1 condensation domain-containing protein [Colwellia maritima]
MLKQWLGRMVDRQDEQSLAQILINYMGEPDRLISTNPLFDIASSSLHLVSSTLQPLPYLLAFDCYVQADKLEILVKYSGTQLNRQKLGVLEQAIHNRFAELIRQEESTLPMMAEDFPLAAAVIKQQPADFLPQLRRQIGRIDDLYPLSPMQSGILFQSLLMPGSGIYINQVGRKVEGQLSPEHFIRVWQMVMSEFANLHNGFVWEALSQPLQFNSGIRDVPYTVKDWRNFTPNRQRELPEESAAAVRSQGFDLSQPPLQHLLIARLCENTYQFLWSIHHLLVDGGQPQS